jgi:hypothetical protein
LAPTAEANTLVLRRGRRFVGICRLPPLVQVVEKGWLRRPAELHRPPGRTAQGTLDRW